MPVKRREVMERYGGYRSETIFGANSVTSSIRTARFQPAIPALLSDDNGITESAIIAHWNCEASSFPGVEDRDGREHTKLVADEEGLSIHRRDGYLALVRSRRHDLPRGPGRRPFR